MRTGRELEVQRLNFEKNSQISKRYLRLKACCSWFLVGWERAGQAFGCSCPGSLVGATWPACSCSYPQRTPAIQESYGGFHSRFLKEKEIESHTYLYAKYSTSSFHYNTTSNQAPLDSVTSTKMCHFQYKSSTIKLPFRHVSTYRFISIFLSPSMAVKETSDPFRGIAPLIIFHLKWEFFISSFPLVFTATKQSLMCTKLLQNTPYPSALRKPQGISYLSLDITRFSLPSL